jgi:hypothetical protein
MPPRSSLLAVVAVVEAIVCFGLLIALSGEMRFVVGLCLSVGTILLCLSALKIIGAGPTSGWLPPHAAIGCVALAGLVFLSVAVSAIIEGGPTWFEVFEGLLGLAGLVLAGAVVTEEARAQL